MSDNYQLRFTLLDFDESLTKLQSFNKALGDLQTKGVLAGSQTQMVAMTKQFENTANQAQRLINSVGTLSGKLEDGYKAAIKTKKAFSAIGPAAEVNTSKVNASLTKTLNLSNNIHQVWRGMAAASGNIWLSWGNFAPMLAGLAAMGSAFKSLSVERQLGWQMEMVGVAADTGATQVAELRKQVLELGTSGIIQGPTQLASALRVLTQAGMDTKEAFTALKPVTDLALVAEVSDGQAAQFMAGARSAFNLNDSQGNLDSQKFREAADQTAKAAAVSQTSIEKMMEALRQGSSEAEKFKLSITDTSTVLAALARYNIEGSAAGTALKNMLTDLAGRTPKAKKAMQELGLSIYTANNELKPFTQIVEEFQNAFEGMNSKEKQEWLRKIFNERGMRAANVLLSMSTEEFKKLHSEIGRAGENMGYTANSAKRLAETSEGVFQRMKNGWEGMFASVGGSFGWKIQRLNASDDRTESR